MPKINDVWQEPKTGMEFVWIPSGSFLMGDVFNDDIKSERPLGHHYMDGTETEDERPVHEVELDGFWLGKFPVTRVEWSRLMGKPPRKKVGETDKNRDRYPVEVVSWLDCQQFILRLNDENSGNFRLPTEAEWEYACRSGGKKERYSGSERLASDVACYYRTAKKNREVGNLSPNGLGLFDMSGNVQEWVQDWYSSTYYAESPRKNPQGPQAGEKRVIRGGYYNCDFDKIRCSSRNSYPPEHRHNGGIGFRVLKEFNL